ncbi:MAG: hypothetical protein HN712_19365 [Gemmatimonadetes bacterium]|nr:hypothetical protein [Gemmatimonadota bacterium]
MKRNWVCSILTVLLLVQVQPGGAVGVGLFNPYITEGARISPETLVPTLRKWYLPQALYSLYGWQGNAYTNYARDRYQRYVSTELEGDRFYDLYGNYVTKGWNIYSFTNEYPRDFGSGIWKDPNFNRWFNRLVVVSGAKGQFHTSLTVGEGIRTTMTPLTFSKPIFDGLQWDFQTDKYGLSVLAARADSPGRVAIAADQGPARQTTFTQLLGLNGNVAIGDFVTLGGTYLTTFHQNSTLSLDDNSIRGVLGGRLNAGNVQRLIVRLSDDSPEDGVGGALLLRERIFIDGVEHPEIDPIIEGGVSREGLLEASGSNTVTLTYNIETDFRPGPSEEITDFREIEQIEIGLVVANDYLVEVASNLQTNATLEPAFLPVEQAEGNITDGSNQRFIRFEYGIPSANELRGVSLAVTDVRGFNLQSEFVSNRRNRRFPNQTIRRGQSLSHSESEAYYVTASQLTYPFFGYGEVFSVEPGYSTSMFIPDAQGFVDYENEENYLYELVDDNDDQDRFPDWQRRAENLSSLFPQQNQFPDRHVFPGLDENQDFISDFNQNQNNQPDYSEPFFRYHVDSPEFLFGTDMNNNTVIDRFENDIEPDYPYKRDSKGYNLYGGVELATDSKLTLGRTRTEQHSSDRRAASTYGLLTLRSEVPQHGLSIQVMEFARKVKDDIPDNLIQWVQPAFSTGTLQDFSDPLIAQDTFINTFYLQLDWTQFLTTQTKLKFDSYNQQGDAAKGTRDERFLGLINKADREFWITPNVHLWPQWKQRFASRTPTSPRVRKTRDLSEVLFFLANYRITPKLILGLGTEYELFSNLKKRPAGGAADYQDNFSRWTLASQFSNHSEYLGYKLTANIGMRWVRTSVRGDADTNAMIFVDVFAGLGTDQ